MFLWQPPNGQSVFPRLLWGADWRLRRRTIVTRACQTCCRHRPCCYGRRHKAIVIYSWYAYPKHETMSRTMPSRDHTAVTCCFLLRWLMLHIVLHVLFLASPNNSPGSILSRLVWQYAGAWKMSGYINVWVFCVSWCVSLWSMDRYVYTKHDTGRHFFSGQSFLSSTDDLLRRRGRRVTETGAEWWKKEYCPVIRLFWI